ncbi:hypothetical protein MNBD_NITROSPINAE02-934 [hydrothermal vent metagenome]|uniref:Zn-ribbon-containing, possibly RNA-binding protein and truncated derivatives n=1 Tax=hydrothermal vent metagenome TaxID=652676 RepID=A0A3B1BZ76_9ZZZZ
MKKLFKPKSMAESLDAALRSINRVNVIYLLKIEREWENIVGRTLAGVSGPVKLSQGKLVLFVREPVWIDSMMYLKTMIIQKVNDLFPGNIVTRIHMVLKNDLNSNKAAPEETDKISDDDFPENEAKDVEKALEKLPDSKLRSTFKRVMLGSLKVERHRMRPK